MIQGVQPNQGLARQVAGTILELRDRATSEEVIQSATFCVLDFFAVVLAARREPLACRISRSIKRLGGTPEATVLFEKTRTSAPLAALANGTLAHALDYDDTLWTYIGHPTSVIFPAALAVAETVDCGGEDLLAAFSLGVETAHRIGSLVTPELSECGWHPSPSAGVFGAAASSSLLMGGDKDSLASALTISTNMASGIKQNFGSQAKPLVIGWASHAGVLASMFAREGISGSEDALEGRQGFYATFARKRPNHFMDEKDRRMAIVSPGVGFKLYPSCTGTHPAIDAIVSLQKEEAINPEEISYIRVEVTPEVLDELIYPVPSSASQGKFSLPYCAAVAMVYGYAGVEHFQDEYVNSPQVRSLMERVKTIPNENLQRQGGEYCPAAHLTIGLFSGERIEKTVAVARGNPGNPLTIEDLKEKFRNGTQRAELSPLKTKGLLEAIMELRSVSSVSRWMKKRVAPLFHGLAQRLALS
jgi:2-methylcitrate dehydratase PrpD